jgi:haloalkane dehalogenase
VETLRTPDEQFANLVDFPFAPHYADIHDGDGGSLRVHYLDEGPADAAPVLLLHGEPTWSYLYRHMIPPLVAAGHRVVVPDQVGFGRSDKPTRMSDYTYARHVAWMSSLVFDVLDLRDVTFFGQDWGGLIGLRLVAADPDRYARVVVGNTGLPDGSRPPTEAFMRWQQFSQTVPELPVGQIVNGGTARQLSDGEIAAYNAPFPDSSYQAGARIWPSLVPTSTDNPAAADNRAAWQVLSQFSRPFLCCFSDGDPITAGGERIFMRNVPGATGQAHTTIEGGGHFLQEDCGPQLAALINTFIATTS